MLLLITFLIGILPGLCVWILLGAQRYAFLWSHILSLALFSTILWLNSLVELPWNFLLWIYIGVISVLLGFTVINLSRRSLFIESVRNYYFSNSKTVLALTAVCISVTLYISLVGVYDRVPSDILRHLERLQLARADIQGSGQWGSYFYNGLSDYYLYYYYAALMVLSGASLEQLFFWLTIFNSIFLLIGVYSVAEYQFSDKKRARFFIGLLSCLFFVLHQGIAGFSYIRYYSLSATLVCMPAFCLSIIYVDRWYHRNLRNREWLPVACAVLLTAFIHLQEAIYIAIMVVLLVIYYQLADTMGKKLGNSLMLRSEINPAVVKTVSVITIGALAALFLVGVNIFDRIAADQNKVVSLSVWFGNLPDTWLVLNPFHQFARVVGLWGLVIYLLAFVYIHKFIRRPLLICGLVIPFATVFNPLFVDIFIRVRDVHVLYRLIYAVPLSLAGAYIVYLGYQGIRTGKISKSVSCIVSGVVLIVTLFSLNTGFTVSTYSRLQDLAAVEEDNSLGYWQDLTDYLNLEYDGETIITDPVTGYIITATTDSISARYKFTTRDHPPINFPDYGTDPFQLYSGKLLVINLRDGGISRTGAISGHWPEDVLHVTQYYSAELLEYLNSEPDRLDLVWQNDRVSVYRIKRN